MNIDLNTLLIAFFGGSFLIGVAAVVKSRKEADNEDAQAQQARAQASATMVSTADDVVALVRKEMAQMASKMGAQGEEMARYREKQAEDECRIDALEDAVMAWDGWADSVLAILDRAVGLLTEEQRLTLSSDVEHARSTRPSNSTLLRRSGT